MKKLITVVFALAIICAQAQKVSDADIARDAQNLLGKFQKTQKTREPFSDIAKKTGFLGSLFGDGQDEQERIRARFTRGSKQQNSIQEEGANDPLNSMSQLMNSLPYEALLPRRRQPLGLLSKLLKVQQESQSSQNPLKQLDKLLAHRKKKSKGKKVKWQNPEFKEGDNDAPYMKIFGPKSKRGQRVDINEDEIKQLLEESMPSLKGGKIIMLSSVPHRKGIFLNIEFETAKEQIYTIKAKFSRKTKQLEIINLTQINVLRKVEDSDDSDEVKITVTPQQAVDVQEPADKKPLEVEDYKLESDTEEAEHEYQKAIASREQSHQAILEKENKNVSNEPKTSKKEDPNQLRKQPQSAKPIETN